MPLFRAAVFGPAFTPGHQSADPASHTAGLAASGGGAGGEWLRGRIGLTSPEGLAYYRFAAKGHECPCEPSGGRQCSSGIPRTFLTTPLM